MNKCLAYAALGFAAVLAACDSTVTGCGGPIETGTPSPVGARTYRGDLGGRQGLLFYAAHDSAMTLVYDTVRCGLFLAWRGPVLSGQVNGDGSYVAQGPVFHRQDADTLWRLVRGADTLSLAPAFLGFTEDSAGSLTLHYGLILPGGDTVRVDEVPSYDDHYGDLALRRDFRFQGLPPGAEVSVRLGGVAFAWKELWSQSANGILAGDPGEETLRTSDDGVSDVKLTFVGSAP